MSTTVMPGRLAASDPDLSERQRRVFARLVALHRLDARPVSTERLARTGGVRQAGAGLRGTLGDLEALGLLERTPQGWRVPPSHVFVADDTLAWLAVRARPLVQEVAA